MGTVRQVTRIYRMSLIKTTWAVGHLQNDDFFRKIKGSLEPLVLILFQAFAVVYWRNGARQILNNLDSNKSFYSQLKVIIFEWLV